MVANVQNIQLSQPRATAPLEGTAVRTAIRQRLTDPKILQCPVVRSLFEGINHGIHGIKIEAKTIEGALEILKGKIEPAKRALFEPFQHFTQDNKKEFEAAYQQLELEHPLGPLEFSEKVYCGIESLAGENSAPQPPAGIKGTPPAQEKTPDLTPKVKELLRIFTEQGLSIQDIILIFRIGELSYNSATPEEVFRLFYFLLAESAKSAQKDNYPVVLLADAANFKHFLEGLNQIIKFYRENLERIAKAAEQERAIQEPLATKRAEAKEEENKEKPEAAKVLPETIIAGFDFAAILEGQNIKAEVDKILLVKVIIEIGKIISNVPAVSNHKTSPAIKAIAENLIIENTLKKLSESAKPALDLAGCAAAVKASQTNIEQATQRIMPLPVYLKRMAAGLKKYAQANKKYSGSIDQLLAGIKTQLPQQRANTFTIAYLWNNLLEKTREYLEKQTAPIPDEAGEAIAALEQHVAELVQVAIFDDESIIATLLPLDQSGALEHFILGFNHRFNGENKAKAFHFFAIGELVKWRRNNDSYPVSIKTLISIGQLKEYIKNAIVANNIPDLARLIKHFAGENQPLPLTIPPTFTGEDQALAALTTITARGPAAIAPLLQALNGHISSNKSLPQLIKDDAATNVRWLIFEIAQKHSSQAIPLLIDQLTAKVIVTARGAVLPKNPEAEIEGEILIELNSIIQLLDRYTSEKAKKAADRPKLSLVQPKIIPDQKTSSPKLVIIRRLIRAALFNTTNRAAVIDFFKSHTNEIKELDIDILSILFDHFNASSGLPAAELENEALPPPSDARRIMIEVKRLPQNNPPPAAKNKRATREYQERILSFAFRILALEEMIEKKDFRAAKENLAEFLKTTKSAKITIPFFNYIIGYLYAGELENKLSADKSSSGAAAAENSLTSPGKVLATIRGEIYSASGKEKTEADAQLASEILLYGMIMRRVYTRRIQAHKVIDLLQRKKEIWNNLITLIEEQKPGEAIKFINNLIDAAYVAAGKLPVKTGQLILISHRPDPFDSVNLEIALNCLKNRGLNPS